MLYWKSLHLVAYFMPRNRKTTFCFMSVPKICLLSERDKNVGGMENINKARRKAASCYSTRDKNVPTN